MLSPAEELASRSMDLEAEREARILAESMALIAERDPEAIARINAGTSISSRVNNIVEPVEAQAQTFPDIKPGQGYGTEAFGPGNTFTSGRELASTEGESLLSSVGNTMRSNPLRDAIAAGRVTMANTRAEEAEEQKQAEITESEQLLAAQDQQRDAQRMMEINATPPATPPAMSASDLARLADAGDENAINQIRLNEIAALSTASDMSLGKRNPALDSITQATIDDGPGDAAIRTVAKKKRNLTQITSTIAELEEFLRLNPGDTQALARLKAAQDAIPVAESEVVTAERKERGGQTPKEFRDQEEDLVNAQGGLNSMRLEDSKDIRALAAAEDSKNINLQGPNFVIPDVTAEIGKGDGADDSGGAGSAGTGKTLFAPNTVKDYQKMYADMLGGKDKDSAKDKWNDFAMIGFAIAAGQDPSALTNIAQGMLDGTKMMKEDRSIEQARQDKINMMAFQSAEEDRRTALAAGVRADERSQDQVNRIALTDLETRQRLTDESRKSKQSLQLYEAKLKIAEKYDKPDSILKTDPALAVISKAFDGIDYAMLGSDDNAFTALEKMGFPNAQLRRFSDIVFPGEPYGGSAAVSRKVTLNEI